MKFSQRIKALVSLIQSIGADPRDEEELRLNKRIFVMAVFLMMIATALWGTIYLSFGEKLVGSISILYSFFNLISLIIIQQQRKIRAFVFIQLILGMVVPSLYYFFLGGFSASSAVVLWTVISPFAALIFFTASQATIWSVAYIILLVVDGLLQPFTNRQNQLPDALVTFSFVLNIGGVSGIMLIILNYFHQQKNEAYHLLRIEQEKAENLLLNILPKEIAAILKNENRTIADNFWGASILFADLVGFTPLTARMAPVEMVNLLNLIFSYFDELVEKYNLEKIRTIGDNYMVAAGVPRPQSDHAVVLARMALEMQHFILSLPPVEGKPVQFRIGINSGPVVGGVIGRKKFVYDLWGDAVNVASRMESQGVAGKIQITQATRDLICSEFTCEARGTIVVKGRGEMITWFLIGDKANVVEMVDLPA
jgi:adenylate cyclase